MKRLLIILLLFSFTGCADDQLIRKTTTDNNITIKWYYYSRITHNSSDFIDIKKGDSTITILKATGVITDVGISNKTILIKLYKPHQGIVYTKHIVKNVFDYKVIIDTTSTYKEYTNIPNGN